MRDHIHIRVIPKASRNAIVKDSGEDGSPHYKIYVTCVPENGKANKDVIKLLAKEIGVAKTAITIIQGHKSRDKVVEIES